MPEYVYTDLTVNVVRDDLMGLYVFGVELDGAFVPIANLKTGGVEKKINAARAAQPAQPEPAPAPAEAAPIETPTVAQNVPPTATFPGTS